MKHRKISIGFIIFICALAGLSSGVTLGQDEEVEYAGTRECRSCHRSYANDQEEAVHFRTLIEVDEAEDDDVILADFESGEDVRETAFEDETRPFTEEDVFFTLGAGRHYQAYVTEVDDDVYRVLPAQWRVADEMWVALELADDWSDPAYDFNSQCAGCHTTNFNAQDLEWDEAGVQCEACHGPGLNHVEIADDAGSSISDDEYDELSSAINFSLDAQVCGQCHIRGTNEETGLPIPVGYHPGGDLLDPSVFTPVDTSNEDAWFETVHAKLPNMQFNEWMQSAHPNAMETAQESEFFDASCLGCHSAAQKRVDYLIDEDWVDEDEFDPLSVIDDHGFGITCASCHNPHEVDEAVFLRDEPYDLCISCHYNGDENEGIHHPVQEMFEGAELIEDIEPIEGAHFSADEGPTCLTCHMSSVITKSGDRASHTFHPILPESSESQAPSTCAACHDSLPNPDVVFLVEGIQEDVRERLSVNSARLATLDIPETDSAEYETYMKITDALTFVQNDGSLGVHNYAYADRLLDYVDEQLTAFSIPDTQPEPTVGPAPTATPAGGIEPIQVVPQPTVRSGFRPMTGVILGIVFLIFAVAAVAFFRRSSDSEV